MFHPLEAGRDVDMQREGSRGQAKRSFSSDALSFLSRIFSFGKLFFPKVDWTLILTELPTNHFQVCLKPHQKKVNWRRKKN